MKVDKVDLPDPSRALLEVLKDSSYPIDSSDLSDIMEAELGARVTKRDLERMVTQLEDKGYDVKKITSRNDDSYVLVRQAESENEDIYRPLGEIETPVLLTGDWHIGHKNFSPQAWKEMANDVDDYNINDIIAPGDLLQGLGVHRTEKKDIKYSDIDEQVDVCCDLLQDINDKATIHASIGNHEEKIKGKHKVGFDPLKAISKRVDNFKYYGSVMTFDFNDEFKYTAMHTSGSTTYADCFDEETEILTKDGFKGHEELSNDDEIATLNPETEELEYNEPKHIIREYYSGPMYHYNGRQFDFLYTPNHRRFGRYDRTSMNEDKGELKFKRANETDVSREKGNGYWISKKNCKWNGKSRNEFEFPYAEKEHNKPVEHIGTVDMEDYCRFMGWFISEGSTWENESKNYEVVISNEDRENIEEIEDLLDNMEINYGYLRDKNQEIKGIRIWSKELHKYLSKFGNDSKSKRVPSIIKELDREKIRAFLDSYLKGDGDIGSGIDSEKGCETKSEQLKDDLQELFLKAGLSTSVSEHRDCYSISINRNELEPRLTNEPEKVDYEGTIWDVTVEPHHTVFIRRNGKVIWTGNSYPLQKIWRNLPDPRPDVLQVGHLHKIVWDSKPNDKLLLTSGTMQRESSFVIWKGHITEIGWMILEEFDSHNKLVRERTPKTY